jgi:hypothetical protein
MTQQIAKAQIRDHGALDAITTESTTSRTLGLSDNGSLISCTNGSAVTITIPTNAAVAFVVGTTVAIEQHGAGQVTISPDTGVTLRKRSSTGKTAAQYATAQLVKLATNEWLLFGDLEA